MHRRLQKELREYFHEPDEEGLRRSKLWTGEQAVTVSLDEDDIRIWHMTLFGPASSPYASQPIYLRVCFPSNYPLSPPKASHDHGVTPFHPNVKTGEVCCCCSPYFCCEGSKNTWSPAMMTGKHLPMLYLSMLAQPHLEGAICQEAATLHRQSSAPGSEYWVRAAMSVGRPPPLWTPTTHASLPRSVRALVRTTLLALRIFERRCTQVDASADITTLAIWPHARTLPEEVLWTILARIARDCMQRYLPGALREGGSSACEPCEEEDAGKEEEEARQS